MNQIVLDFLTSHRVCSLTTLLSDTSPHAAALHYSHQAAPLTLYFGTENTGRKTEALLHGEKGKASVVVGFSEEEWKTVQMDGEIRVVTDKEELKKIYTIHYAKHPDAEQYKDEPATIFLAFTPTWWRYTDYNSDPPNIYSPESITKQTYS